MRLAPLLAAAGLVSAALVATAPAAQATQTAGTCSVQIPTRVAITTPYRGIPVRLGSNCAAAGTEYASWHAYHSTKGWQAIVIFDATSADTWDLYDWEPLGRWTWRPSSAWDYNGEKVAQNTTYTDIKVGSWAGLTVTRSGSRVTLTSSVARYSSTYERLIPWAGAVGQMQYKVPGTTTWKALKQVYSSSSGKYTYSYSTTTIRDYRVYFPATSVIWNAASSTVRR